MQYIISDIHGCYAEYRELLKKINFSDEDDLYILGDAMDRGPEPIRVIQDLMRRANVFYILGNHDDMFLAVIRHLAVEITSKTMQNITADALMAYQNWMANGGTSTIKQFLQLSQPEQRDILDYLEDASYYEMLENKHCLYVLVHAGIDHFSPKKELDTYQVSDFLWHRPDYGKRYFPSKRIFLVTGHTPTPLIREDRKPLIYQSNGHIAIDCGCVFGGMLAAYCIETGKTYYVHSKQNPLSEQKTNEQK